MRYFSSMVAVAMIIAAGAVFVLAQETTAPKVIHGGVLNGKAISLPKAEYPEDLKRAGVEGTVQVDVTIDETGEIISAKAAIYTIDMPDDKVVDKAEAVHLLINAAEKAAMEAKFAPTLLNGQAVRVNGLITYHFSLAAKSEDELKAINGDMLNSKAIELPNPTYPAAAKAVDAAGIVSVEVTIDESGNVISAKAVSGHPLLQSAAVAAARQAKFAPTQLEGTPVKVSGIISYNFVLSEKP